MYSQTVLNKNVSYKGRKREAQAPQLHWLDSHQPPTILCAVSQTFLLQAAFCLPQSPGLLAGGRSPVIWRNLLVSMVTVTHWYGRRRVEREVGSVSFPQPLAPCGTGMSAVSWASSGRKELRSL